MKEWKVMTMQKADILLESGTNEIEVIMFEVDGGMFGINVLKVREIINATAVTSVPNAHSHVDGMMRLREDVMPVINLARVLGLNPSSTPELDKFIICEFNQVKVVFRVHSVSRIYRLQWEQIEKPSELSTGETAYAIGVIKLDDAMPIFLDFEKIILEISPKYGIDIDRIDEVEQLEKTTKIVLAEDSAVLRRIIKEALTKAGYDHLQFYENGTEAWDYLSTLANDNSIEIADYVDIVITDLEMPQMDGHHLTQRIKTNERLQHLPVIIFSSLISEDLYHKGDDVGADAQVNKKEVVHLIKEIERFTS